MRTIKPGDLVSITAEVVEVGHADDIGVRVELYSKTDQYKTWVSPDHIERVIVPDVPDEPADGTWLALDAVDTFGLTIKVWQRCDADAPTDPDRRFPRHWFAVHAGSWVDWPTVVAAGAGRARRLKPAEASTPDPADVERDLLERRTRTEFVLRLVREEPGVHTDQLFGTLAADAPELLPTGGRQALVDYLAFLKQCRLIANEPTRADRSYAHRWWLVPAAADGGGAAGG